MFYILDAPECKWKKYYKKYDKDIFFKNQFQREITEEADGYEEGEAYVAQGQDHQQKQTAKYYTVV